MRIPLCQSSPALSLSCMHMASIRVLSVSEMWGLWKFQPVVRYAHNLANVRRIERVPQSLVPRPPVEMGEGKGCVLCRNGLDKFGYRDVLLLRQFLTPDGLIVGRRHTGICQKMQNRITRAIRRSRQMGLLPNFTPSKPHTES